MQAVTSQLEMANPSARIASGPTSGTTAFLYFPIAVVFNLCALWHAVSVCKAAVTIWRRQHPALVWKASSLL